MTQKELATLARIVNEIRGLSPNAPTHDGHIQSIAAVDCIAYSISAELIKDQAIKTQFLVDCKLHK